MNRILTTLVQLMLLAGTVTVIRMMLPELKEDIAEMKNDLLNRK